MVIWTSNKAALTDAALVRAILDTFEYNGFKCKIRSWKGNSKGSRRSRS